MRSKFRIFHHIDQKTIDLMYEDYSPVFILSTGRSGSKFVHNLIGSCNDVKSYHEAFPTLQYFSNFAYHRQDQFNLLSGMFHAARMELILDAYNSNKIFCESNQCLTFFSHAIINLFSKAKFIHLIRHPGDFIRSALRKGWHKNDTIWESGRVRMPDIEEWNSLCHIAKLAWVWNTTNSYIANFLENISPDDKMVIRIEDLSEDLQLCNDVFQFIGSKNQVSLVDLNSILRRGSNKLIIHNHEPPNMKKMQNYPHYNQWTIDDKKIVRRNAQQLADIYGYKL